MKLVGTITASKPIFYYIVYDIISYRLGDFYNIFYIYIYIYLRIFSICNTHIGRGEKIFKEIYNGIYLKGLNSWIHNTDFKPLI